MNNVVTLNNLDSLKYFVPELILTGGIIALIIFDLIAAKRISGSYTATYTTGSKTASSKLLSYISLAILAASFIAAICTLPYVLGRTDMHLFNSLIRLNGFTIFFKLFFLLATAVTILFTIAKSSDEINKEAETYRGVEYFALLLISNLGLFILSSAYDLLSIYIGLETVSISSYLLVSSHKGVRKSSEAGLKYVIYGAIASGIMLYGMAFIYGINGSTSLGRIFSTTMAFLPTNYYQLMLTVSFMMIFVGLAYKIAAAPMHMWCPDVYEGAPTEITAFLSVAPKAAGFAVIITFFYGLLAPMLSSKGANIASLDFSMNWQLILAAISVLTMTIGNFAALHQTNVKRLLAYSSIAHAGYMLLGLVVLNQFGIRAILIYLPIYLIMNMGAFLVVYIMEKTTGSVDIKEYEGIGWKMPLLGVSMTIFMFALIGLPPLSGFIAKVYIFGALIEEGWYALAVIGVMNGVVSLYYYSRIVRAIFLRAPAETAAPAKPLGKLDVTLLLLFAIPTVLLGVYFSPLVNFINRLLNV